MKSIFKIALGLILILGISVSGQAQRYQLIPKQNPESIPPYKAYTLAFDMINLVNSGYKFDFEKRLNKPELWLQVGITGFLGNNNVSLYDDDAEEVKGMGLSVGIKKFFPHSKFWYIKPSIGYNHYNVFYSSKVWNSFTEDNLTYHRHSFENFSQTIGQAQTSIVLGSQSQVENIVFVDVYAGLALKYSFNNNKFDRPRSYMGYDYRGVYFTMGLRIGFGFGTKKYD